MVPVEKMRGATIIPALPSSLAANTVSVSFDGSCSVVTPKPRLAALTQLCCGMIPSAPNVPCQCTSISPGSTVLPAASTTKASGGTATALRDPTARIRLPSISTTPFSITSVPRIEITLPPTIATLPVGTSVGLEKEMFFPEAGGAGRVFGAPSRKAKASGRSRE